MDVDSQSIRGRFAIFPFASGSERHGLSAQLETGDGKIILCINFASVYGTRIPAVHSQQEKRHHASLCTLALGPLFFSFVWRVCLYLSICTLGLACTFSPTSSPTRKRDVWRSSAFFLVLRLLSRAWFAQQQSTCLQPSGVNCAMERSECAML